MVLLLFTVVLQAGRQDSRFQVVDPRHGKVPIIQCARSSIMWESTVQSDYP